MLYFFSSTGTILSSVQYQHDVSAMFDPKNLLYTVRKETKCSEETEILHEQVHEATRKSESHELIRVIYSKKRVVTKHTNKQTSRGFELTIEMRSYHMKIKK